MMAALCTLWRTDKVEIHGYIATYLESSLGVMQEELAICYQDVKKCLEPAKTITLETANVLTKRHSLLSANWYNGFKKHLAAHYKTMLFFTALSAAWKLYQVQKLKKFKISIDENWTKLREVCQRNANINVQEFI